jgi:hypothetical protein
MDHVPTGRKCPQKKKNENTLLGSGELGKNLQLPHNASANHNCSRQL